HPAGVGTGGRGPDEAGHLVVQEKFDALGPRARLQWPHQTRAGSAAWTGEPGALVPDRMILTRRRVARTLRADIVWGDFLEHDAIGHEKFVRGGAMIGEPPHDGSIIVAVIRPAIGLHDGPVGQIGKDEVWRIRNAVFALRARAAAKRDIAAAQYRMPTNIVVRFDHEHGRPRINSRNGGKQPRRASANDHYIRLQVPACRQVTSALFPYARTTDIDRAVTSTCCHGNLSLCTHASEEHHWDRSRVCMKIDSKASLENVERQQGTLHTG